MAPKLIFYKNTAGGDSFGFCPLKHGCADCFVPPKCKGENDKTIAFNLRLVKGHYVVTRIRSAK